MSLQTTVKLLRDGEPVSAGVTNRPLIELDARLEYLYELLDAAAVGSTVYARQVTVEEDAQVGMPVYLNPVTGQFERGLAQIATNPVTGELGTSPSSEIWGVVSLKHNDTLADLLLYGYASLDIAVAVGGEVQAGTYYLSGVTPGRLVHDRPAVSVKVLRATADGKIFINPLFVDFLDSHRHCRFDLVTAPAGSVTPPGEGERHTITDPQADWPGWLPADHTIFAGKAPEGAVFGYNLKEHTALQNAWPPVPPSQAYLEWDRGLDTTGATGVPLGAGGLCQIDRNGIWWMSDCYGDVPWPAELTTDSEYQDSEASEYVPPECPRETGMLLTLWFSRLNFMTDTSIVTSLQSADSRLLVRCAGTSLPGTVGDLELLLDLQFALGDTDRAGYLVVKELEDDRLHRGPVVESLYAATDNILLAGPVSSPLDPAAPSGARKYQGPIAISFLPENVRELQAQLIRLDGATEENYPVLYVGLPADNPSSFTARFEVPANAADSLQFRYRARVLGRITGTLPDLVFECARVPRPVAGLTTPLTVAEAFTPLTCGTAATLASNDQAVEAESEAFTVAAGDLVFIRVTRQPGSLYDSYGGDVGFMQQIGILTTD